MSSDPEVAQLRLEVEILREELASLRSEVDRLRRSFAGLRAGSGGSAPQSPLRDSSYAASLGSYSQVDEVSSAGSEVDSRASPAPSDQGPTSLQSSSASPGSGLPLNWRQREEICDQIGLWIGRCLRGEHRGTSGRDRNPLASRIWLVCRDTQGIHYNPPLLFRSFASAKPYCKQGSECGDAVFIGLPSEREAVRVVGIAGLHWSGVYQ